MSRKFTHRAASPFNSHANCGLASAGLEFERTADPPVVAQQRQALPYHRLETLTVKITATRDNDA